MRAAVFSRLTLSLLLVAVVLAGCSSPSNGDEGEVASASTTVAQSSPFGRYFDDGGSVDAAQKLWKQRANEQTELCMRREGFEFVSPLAPLLSSAAAMSELTQDEWNRRFGYGISTTAPEIVAVLGAPDPNTAHLAQLSEQERASWLTALVGADIASGSAEGSVPLDRQGCTGVGFLAASSGQDVLGGLEEFSQVYQEQMARLGSTDSMVRASGDWAGCMAEAGYEYPSQQEVLAHFQAETAVAVSGLRTALSRLDVSEVEAIIQGSTLLVDDVPGFDPATLAAIKVQEIATAVADQRCYDRHVRDVFEPLRDEIENGLLENYGHVLDVSLDAAS